GAVQNLVIVLNLVNAVLIGIGIGILRTSDYVDRDLLGVEAQVAGGGVSDLDVVAAGHIVDHVHSTSVDVVSGIVLINDLRSGIVVDLVELNHAIVCDLIGTVLNINPLVLNGGISVVADTPDILTVVVVLTIDKVGVVIGGVLSLEDDHI